MMEMELERDRESIYRDESHVVLATRLHPHTFIDIMVCITT